MAAEEVACSAELIIICELLCYLQNNFSKSTTNGLITVISGFFTVDEIVFAKNKLFEAAKELFTSESGRGSEDIPHQTTRRPGVNKRRLDATDILELYGVLDRAKVTLPRFAAMDLSRLPPFEPDATDFCALAASVELLHGQMADVLKQLNQRRPEAGFDGSVGAQWSSMVPAAQPEQPKVKESFADLVRSSPARQQPPARSVSAVVQRRPTVKGTRQVDSHTTGVANIKAVPRRLMAFVSRLHIDTTAEELTSFLTESGLKDVNCRKLAAPAGRSFRTAAFRVSCSADSKNLFYDENSWPTGVELRDWYISAKPKDTMTTKPTTSENGSQFC